MSRYSTSTSQYYCLAVPHHHPESGSPLGQLPLGAPVVSKTTEQAAAQITRGDLAWGPIGSPGTVTYAFRDTAPSYSHAQNNLQSKFQKFDTAQKNGARLALALWSDVADITFKPVNPTGHSNNAKILLGAFDTPDENGADYAFGYPPGTFEQSGDVWLNNHFAEAKDMRFGGYGFQTLIHEIGHAIGLGHPGNYDSAVDFATYEHDAEYIEDTRMYSVMSYFDASHTGGDHGGLYASSPLIHDIASLQRLYGANRSTRTGDTTYGFDSNADREVFRITSAASQPIFAVWDAGGTDTFDFSGYSQNQLIDLRAARFSDVGGLRANVSIAAGVTIEHAVGGAGADVIYGNAVWNLIRGGGGNDRVQSSRGADLLYGDGGDDVLDGEQDSDQLYGGSGNDQLAGGDGDDHLDGGSGADRMEGGVGDDTYIVDDAYDWVGEATSGGADRVWTALGSYRLPSEVETLVLLAGGVSGAGNELANQITGNEQDNRLDGAGGHDSLWGGEGADTLSGGTGNDFMAGGNGSDFFTVDSAWDRVLEQALGGWDIVAASVTFALEPGAEVEELRAANASLRDRLDLTGNEFSQRLFGSAGVNRLSGADGEDRLYGASGNDIIKGGRGNDVLYGGAGKDVLYGESGRDFFVFDTKLNKKTNVDTIRGFSVKDDAIRLENKVFTKVGKGGKLKSDAFWTGKAARDASDRVIYDKGSGALSYDADGSGYSSAIKFAQLSKSLKLSASDFYVV
jgi:serralysin